MWLVRRWWAVISSNQHRLTQLKETNLKMSKWGSPLHTVRACRASFSCGDWILWESRCIAAWGLEEEIRVKTDRQQVQREPMPERNWFHTAFTHSFLSTLVGWCKSSCNYDVVLQVPFFKCQSCILVSGHRRKESSAQLLTQTNKPQTEIYPSVSWFTSW